MGRTEKGLDQGDIGACMILGGFVGMIISAFIVSFVLLAIATLSIIIGFLLILKDKKDDKDAHIANINMFQSEYDEYVEKLGIVKSDMQVTLFEVGKYNFEVKILHYLWIDSDCIKLFPMAEYYKNNRTSSMSRPDITELKLKSIPMDSILYFEEVGELRKYTTVSGGGTSLKGALLGYAVADDVGAIIGSREPIKTNVVSEDERRIELIYKNQEEQIQNLEFKHDAYDVFKKLMPFKELRKIISLNTIQDIKNEDNTDTQEHQTVKDKLKQLKDLQTEGLITEEEFTEQKKKILETI